MQADDGDADPHSQLVVMGRLGAPYGIKGWLHIQSYANPLENILNHKAWLVQRQEQWLPLQVEEGRRHGAGVVAKLQGIDTPEQAALWTNSLIAVERASLVPLAEDEFYWADLTGLKVVTTAGECLGVISHIYNNAGTDIMVIVNDGKEHHVPFIMNDTVTQVDFDSRQVIVDWEILK